jgi:putative glutamine amidotransferase
MTPHILIPGQKDRLVNYGEALRRAGGYPHFSTDPAEAAECAGLLLPGGGDLAPALYGQPDRGSQPPDHARDRLELTVLEAFIHAGKPILGICRGCQLLNVFLGGTLLQDIPNHAKIDGEDRMHRAAAAADSLAGRLYGSDFWVNSAHHQALDRLGQGLRITVRAADGTPEAVEHDTLPLWGFQWHPERLFPLPDREVAVGAAVFDFFLGELLKNTADG